MAKGLISVDLNIPHTVQWLQLSNNLIYELEDNIFETLGLRHIIELNLDRNAIQSVGLNAFSGLKKLKSIDLSYNRLHSIPSRVFLKIPSLIIVSLHGNPLNYIQCSEPFLFSSSIQVLDISYCRINHIPELALPSLHSLVKLNISSNHIENIDYISYKDLIYLEEVDLSNNKLTCDYKNEDFFTWASFRRITVFGSVCEMATTPHNTAKMLDKMINYESVSTETDMEDLSINFGSECSCTTSNSIYEKSSVNSETEITRKNENNYLSLFIVLSFIIGLAVGISVTVSFWLCYNVFRFRKRHHLCYSSMRYFSLRLFEDIQ